MKHLPFQVAHRWISRLTESPDPITFNKIQELATEFDWKPTKFSTIFTCPSHLEQARIIISFNKKSLKVGTITIPLANAPTPSLESGIRSADLYIEYINKAQISWGIEYNFMTNPTATTWKLHENAYIELRLRPGQIIAEYQVRDESKFH